MKRGVLLSERSSLLACEKDWNVRQKLVLLHLLKECAVMGGG